MPSATLTVQENNDLLITFNDTITQFTITESDIYLQIYGPDEPYSFTWSGSFASSSSVLLNVKISSSLQGIEEYMYVEFPLLNNFKSIYSLRGTNPDYVSNRRSECTGFIREHRIIWANCAYPISLLSIPCHGLIFWRKFYGNNVAVYQHSPVNVLYFSSKCTLS